MVSPQLALQLKQAGLPWRPSMRDTFALLGTGMDEQIFAISDSAVLIQLLHGQPVVTFHGSVEWALDSVQLADALWLPSETQVRQELERRLDERGGSGPSLQREAGGYACGMEIEGPQRFSAASASDAYAHALLFLLGHERVIVASA
jgi:hypothetical protein